MRALVTDGIGKHDLAITRSLGRQRIDISVISHKENTVAFHSKYCSEKIVAPPPQEQEEYTRFLLEKLASNTYDVLYLCGDQVARIVLDSIDEVRKYTHVALPPNPAFEVAYNKEHTMRFADAMGISVPNCRYPVSIEEAERIAMDIGYPVVIKGSLGSGSDHIRYAMDPQEFREGYLAVVELERGAGVSLPMIQEYVVGEGYGFSALLDRGKLVTYVAHKRTIQYPVTGGISAVVETVEEPDLAAHSLRILHELDWHGVAMLEYRRDRTSGEFKLLEINPRFWGALDLALAAGVDFPRLYWQVAMGEPVAPVERYTPHKRFVWIVPEGALSVISKPSSLFRFLRYAVSPKSARNISFRDPLPGLWQLRRTLWVSLNNLKHPVPRTTAATRPPKDTQIHSQIAKPIVTEDEAVVSP